jgi:diguanylate cyclase (GGDEF)-like protein/PAS domain S-box-containing protein
VKVEEVARTGRGDDLTAAVSPVPPVNDLDESLGSWLENHREALVGAVNPNGETVDIPPSIRLGEGHRVDSRSLLDLVVPEDMKLVTDAFVSALARRVGVTRIRLSSDPERLRLLQYLDLRARHGVILRMVALDEGPQEQFDDALLPVQLIPARPRLCVITKSEVATILAIDEATCRMLGWSADEMTGRSTLDFIHPDDHVRAIDNWMSRFASDRGHSVQTVRLRYLCKDGSWLWIETSNDFQERSDGQTVVLSQLIDVSEEMSVIEALRHSERFLREVTDTVPVGLFHVAADGTVAFVNPVLRSLIGDAEIATHGDLAHAMSLQGKELESAIDRVLSDGTDVELGLPLGRQGVKRSAMVTLRGVVEGPRVLGVLGCIVDVTELKILADTDGLTGLMNRRSIVELLESELLRHSGDVSVIFADLDGFKQVNDRYGHQVGDQLLAVVADRLSAALRPGDRIGRLGGDEFLIFCPGVTETGLLGAIARRLRDAMDEEFELPGATVRVVASLGIACGGPGATVDSLISHADAAMYASKQSGTTKNGFEAASSIAV